MAATIHSVELKVFTHTDFRGSSVDIYLKIPVPFDFTDKEVRSQVLCCWKDRHALPPCYEEINDFIDIVKSITGKVDQLMLEVDPLTGSYVTLVIHKPNKAERIVGRLRRLVKRLHSQKLI